MPATLFLIPARGGSKGLPGKNIKSLQGRPLLTLAIDVARAVADSGAGDVIAVSTDDDAIAAVAEAHGLPVPFRRPPALAADTAGSWEVLLHALDFYAAQGRAFDRVALLQPTSPFRQPAHLRGALAEFARGGCDAVISVKETAANPYYLLCEEDADGFLAKSKQADLTRRQDVPTVYEYNGALYVFDTAALRLNPPHRLRRVRKFLMEDLASLDIDTPLDWDWAEFLLSRNYVTLPSYLNTISSPTA